MVVHQMTPCTETCHAPNAKRRLPNACTDFRQVNLVFLLTDLANNVWESQVLVLVASGKWFRPVLAAKLAKDWQSNKSPTSIWIVLKNNYSFSFLGRLFEAAAIGHVST
jgi:hypothetical protein